jgi:hypothetical protein
MKVLYYSGFGVDVVTAIEVTVNVDHRDIMIPLSIEASQQQQQQRKIIGVIESCSG